MNVIIIVPSGEKFRMAIDVYDTVMEIKRSIEAGLHIPFNSQFLFHCNVLMDDHATAFHHGIYDGSFIELVIIPELPPELPPQPRRSPIPALRIRNILSRRTFPLPVDPGDTVAALKRRIRSADDTLDGDDFDVYERLVKLEDHRRLSDYEICCDTEELMVVPVAPEFFVEIPEQTFEPAVDPVVLVELQSQSGMTRVALTVQVVVFGRRSRARVEVRPEAKVAELRAWLERERKRKGFELPEEGYFFIHDGDVMAERKSFRWHGIENGDTVEVFPGTILTTKP